MATIKISAMTPATSMDGTELIPIVQSGANKYATHGLVMQYSDRFLQAIREKGSVNAGRTVAEGSPTTTITLVDNRCQLVMVQVLYAKTLTGVRFLQLTQGNYTADQNNRLGLYTESGGQLTLVASCANDGNFWKSAAGWVSAPFSATYAATRGVYYVGYLYNNSAQVTAPTIAGVTQISNLGLSMGDMTNNNVLAGYKNACNDLVPNGTLMSDFSANPNYLPAYFLLY